MEKDLLKTELFRTKKETFFEERSRLRPTLTVPERKKFIDDWVKQALLSQEFIEKKTYWYDVLERKTSQDGLLQLGFELGECVGLPNPLLYIHSLRGATRRRNFLKYVLDTIILKTVQGW
jgi:hypothetical protein